MNFESVVNTGSRASESRKGGTFYFLPAKKPGGMGPYTGGARKTGVFLKIRSFLNFC